MAKLEPTEADLQIEKCLEKRQNFALVAGAGSGKTTSLVTALTKIRAVDGMTLRQNGQRAACITFTKRAVEVIKSRLGYDDLYLVSTLHSFLWGEISHFQSEIAEALVNSRIPNLITKAEEKDNGGNSKEARNARSRVIRFREIVGEIKNVSSFTYDDSVHSDYLRGKLSHDDIIDIAAYILTNKPIFRKILGFRFPFIFVDEAQDTFQNIIEGINLTCSQEGLPIVGYFGDPWQQIYDDGAGNFAHLESGTVITKTENYRCSLKVISLLNAFRTDVSQVAAGKNKDVVGSVEIILVPAEQPTAPRGRYSDDQIVRALTRLDEAIAHCGWSERKDIMKLFLARQMIARRLNFSNLNQLFNGTFASKRAQQEYEEGTYYLLKPFVNTICPLIQSFRNSEQKICIEILVHNSPGFNIRGANKSKSLKEMIVRSTEILEQLNEVWSKGTLKEILQYCAENEIIEISERIAEQLSRPKRVEPYDEELFGEEKGEWLADNFFDMNSDEIQNYCDFIKENTTFSTQHGVKGEEYKNVLVVYDDVEAAWNLYNFAKLLTPSTAGEPTDGQLERGRKLAYVCFSRAEENLRIILFTRDPTNARDELIEKGLFEATQIHILD